MTNRLNPRGCAIAFTIVCLPFLLFAPIYPESWFSTYKAPGGHWLQEDFDQHYPQLQAIADEFERRFRDISTDARYGDGRLVENIEELRDKHAKSIIIKRYQFRGTRALLINNPAKFWSSSTYGLYAEVPYGLPFFDDDRDENDAILKRDQFEPLLKWMDETRITEAE